MTHADRLRGNIVRLAPTGDTPELTAAVTAYISAAQATDRDPWTHRVMDHYLQLPLNQKVFLPIWLKIRTGFERLGVAGPFILLAAFTAELLLLTGLPR